MNTTLFIALVFVLQVMCFIAGRRASKQLNTQEDYFLAGKDVRFFPLLMTFIATQIGGGLVLGSAEEAYRFGWAVMLYPIGSCLGFVLLACGIGKRLAKFKVSTIAQLFEEVYSSTRLKQIASVLSILSLFMILVAQVIASRKFMLSLGVDQLPLFLAFWGIIILYTAIGGLKAVVSIDIIQALFFIIVFTLGFSYVVYSIKEPFFMTVTSGVNSETFDFNASKLSGWLLMPLLFMVIEQDMAQRCFAAQLPRTVTLAAAFAAVATLIICIIPVYFGVVGKQIRVDVLPGSSVFMDVAQALTTPSIAAFIGCAVLMAVISTAISLINAVSSNLSQDFEFSCFGQGIDNSRWMTGLIGVAAVAVSFYFVEIVDLLIQSYELSVYCLFIPVIFALFKAKGNTLSATLAMVGGAFGFYYTRTWDQPFPKEFFALVISLTGFIIGEIYARRKLSEQLTVFIE